MKFEWEIKKLGDLCNISSSKRIFAKEYCNKGIPFYRGKEIVEKHKGNTVSTELFISEERYAEIKERNDVPEIGDILLSSVGTLGIPWLVDEEKFYFKDGNLTWLRAGKELDNKFLYLWLCSPDAQQQIDAKCIGSTQKAITMKTLSKFEIRIPSIDIQRKISDILFAIINKIGLNKKINNNLYQQLDIIYRITYSYLPSDELPEGWNCVSLGTLCDSISIKHSFDKEKLIFLNTGDVENGHFLHSTYSPVKSMPGQAKKSIRTNDILYSEIRPINRHFAFVNFQADDFVVSTKLMVIRSREIDPRRLYHFLTTQDVINELQIEAESRSGTFPQIRFENIQRLPIIIAPPDIELQFAEILKNYYNVIDSNIRENQQLIILRDTILPKLISGEIDVADIEI